MARFGLGRGGKEDETGQPAQGAPGATPTQPATPGLTPPPGGPGQTPPTGVPGQTPVPPGSTGELTLSERLEGLRSWVAQLDRRIGVRTYAGAAALVLALAAAAVALVLVLQLRDDSARTGDVERLREEIAGVEDSAAKAAQEDVRTAEQRLTQLETEISEITSNQDSAEQQITVLEDDIQDLRSQIDEIEAGPSGAGSTGGSTADSADSP